MTRRFDEREVAMILRKATEVRHDMPEPEVGGGLTLAEVKEVAAEAGIDPTRVDQAARGMLAPPTRSSMEVFTGTPIEVLYETEFDIELGEEDRAELVRQIRAVLNRHGVVGEQSGRVEWMDSDGVGGRYVTVTPFAGGTRLEVSGTFRNAAAGAVGIGGVVTTVGAAGVFAAVSAAGPIGWIIAPLALGGAFVIPRLTIGRVIRREERQLADLTDHLRTVIASFKPGSSADTGPG